MTHERSDVYSIGKKNPNLPFHPAVRAGDYIFVSGQVAKDADGNMCVGNIEEECRLRHYPGDLSDRRGDLPGRGPGYRRFAATADDRLPPAIGTLRRE